MFCEELLQLEHFAVPSIDVHMHQFCTWYGYTIRKENRKPTILVMEHVLLSIEFGFSLFVPEVPPLNLSRTNSKKYERT
ncbi:hypothetical protein V6N11_012269 [Hibiscus sabdariffa]|uniref:Uncharacterized protein n=1 Tax=Hibiscus sabdariffa TaxID=183260 RepID=A0ABR2QAZ4_9ROSI